jgi:molybdopterin molybdotransferase
MATSMMTQEEALAKILETVPVLPSRVMPLSDAAGCFAARDIFARLPLPLFDNSAMDGYAVVSHDCRPGKILRVVGEQAAGIDHKNKIRAGEAIRIFTGAPMPNGADAVVMQEDVERDGSQITVNTTVSPGEFVRRRGCDLSEGQKILETGDQLRAENLALLAAQGLAKIEVGGPLDAAIVSTGDELVPPGTALQPGQLYESNSVLLHALLEKLGVNVQSSEHAADNRESLDAALRTGLKHDVLIISGGVSVGQRDLVKPSLRELGVKIELWRVSMKPGKPFLFGRAGNCAIFGLPGNPVSAFVTFLILVRSALVKMMGAGETALSLPKTSAQLTSDVLNEGDRIHYLRGELCNGQFTPMGRQESHALFGLSRSNALLPIAPGEKMGSGAIVTVLTWN